MSFLVATANSTTIANTIFDALNSWIGLTIGLALMAIALGYLGIRIGRK